MTKPSLYVGLLISSIGLYACGPNVELGHQGSGGSGGSGGSAGYMAGTGGGLSCNDQIVDGTETDLNCGGPTCPPCANSLHCKVNTDCASGECVRNLATEFGICNAACASNADCSGGACVGGRCMQSPCSNGVMDGSETDVDCGGGSCPTCGFGRQCQLNTDCAAQSCYYSPNADAAFGTCELSCYPNCPDTCVNGIKDGDESDVDCGGSCSPCAVGEACVVRFDCSDFVCTSSVCAAPTCADGIANGGETDVDCGGTSCPPCADHKDCKVDADCTSESCQVQFVGPDTAHLCFSATCTDMLKNALETDVDCGGPTCPACALGQHCLAPADCASNTCGSGVCLGHL